MLYIYGRMLVVLNLPQYIPGINEKSPIFSRKRLYDTIIGRITCSCSRQSEKSNNQTSFENGFLNPKFLCCLKRVSHGLAGTVCFYRARWSGVPSRSVYWSRVGITTLAQLSTAKEGCSRHQGNLIYLSFSPTRLSINRNEDLSSTDHR